MISRPALSWTLFLLENCYGIALQSLKQFVNITIIIISITGPGPYFGWSTTTVQEAFSLARPGPGWSHGLLLAIVGIMNRGELPAGGHLVRKYF